jgi:type II restriction/modification system DNA methylase subunit YeeA
MNRNTLKNYAPQARRDCIAAVTDRAASYGLRQDRIEPMTEQGDVVLIAGTSVPRDIATKRKRLEERITRHGFEPTMEAIAYTWFNRFAAIRFMELHGYLEHGYRVLSHPAPDKPLPEILEHAAQVELSGVNPSTVIELKLDGTRDPELYRMLVLAQCNALHAAMPFLFERIDDETELLLPENLLHSDSLIRKLVNGIDEEDWQDVEIIGWLYQFYIAEKKDQVIGKVVKSEDIPAATQLFTPNWIVKYLVQNSLGRQWLATYPDSPLKQQMEYYIEPAEQTPEVQAQLKAITPDILNPEELTLLDPACGSGHILVEAYDLFKAIYQERGYRARDIPSLILQKNLFGLEIDDRAAQLAAFALMMKARADDRRIFANGVQPHILAIQESKGLNAQQITEALNRPLDTGETQGQPGNIAQGDAAQLITLFEHGKTFGSLIRVPENLAKKLPAIAERVKDVLANGEMLEQTAARSVEPLIEQSHHLAQKYDCVVANPPYMGNRAMPSILATFINSTFPNSKADLYAVFLERGFALNKLLGYLTMITMHGWMFISSFEKLRTELLWQHTLICMAHLGPRAFSEISGEVVQTTASCWRNAAISGYRPTFFKLTEGDELTKRANLQKKLSRYEGICQHDFGRIPGSPIAYSFSPRTVSLFNSSNVGDFTFSEGAIKTGNNDRFLRFVWEVDRDQVGPQEKWRMHPKGGGFRRWSGNVEWVVDWSESARRHYREDHVARTLPEWCWDLEGICWSEVSMGKPSFRLIESDEVANNTALALFPKEKNNLCLLLGYLNSSFVEYLLRTLSQTFHFLVGDIQKVPLGVEVESCRSDIESIVLACIDLSKQDWNSHETAISFKCHPFIHIDVTTRTIEDAYNNWLNLCMQRSEQIANLESCLNHKILAAYNINDELSSSVSEGEVSLYHPNREEDIKRFLSYTIGCMMGRYSLDKPGLIYAHSGNQGFDPSQYRTFPADGDGIIPIMETDWFPDDASNRLVEFISVAWSKEHLAENLQFIAESLGPNRNEQPSETIRRYFATSFYKHHLQMYKRRPIYWLFSSGKQRAFQCLVYLHRYHEGTLARMRTEYVIPLQGKIAARIDQLADDIAAASSTAYRKKLEKERETLRKQHAELQAFDEQLRHYADRRIRLDLDDGVKVNYGKFGDLLADVKAVTGGNDEL